MADELLLSEERDGVLCLRFNALRRKNALSRPLLAAAADAIARADRAALGIVLAGGTDIFSAGADFRELTGTSEDIGYDDAVGVLTSAIRESPKTVIAAIEGPCMGAAVDVALSCDLRVVGERSYMQVPAIRLGLLYNPVAVDRLRRSYPLDSVKRLLLLGEKFQAQAALAAGFASVVVPAGAAQAQAVQVLSRLPEAALLAAAATKKLLGDPDPDAGRKEHWQAIRRELLDSPERQAAIAQAHQTHGKKPE